MASHEQPAALEAGELRKALPGSYIGNQIVVVAETTSTNDLVWQRARDGAADGLVVFAETQSAGRGQRGQRWESLPRQSLLFSILLRPALAPAESARLTSWLAQTIAATVAEEFLIPTTVKLPNDIFSGVRKIAGVLVEMKVVATGAYAAIAGAGVNVNQAASDFPEALRDRAGSLAMMSGQPVDRQHFAEVLLRALDRTYRARFGR